MSYAQEIRAGIVLGGVFVIIAIAINQRAAAPENLTQAIFGIGAFLLWVSGVRSFFRFMWFATKENQSTIYGGLGAKNVRTRNFARWLMGLDEHGQRAD